MKKFIPPFIFLLFLSFAMIAYHCAGENKGQLTKADAELTASNSPAAPSGSAHVAGDIQVNFDKSAITADGATSILTDNWGVIVLGLLTFAETIVRLTPTQKDNTILKFLVTVFNAVVPNKKKGGGVF